MSTGKPLSDGRYTCGPKTPSSCIPLSLGFKITAFDECALPCDANLNDLLFQFDKVLAALTTSTDISKVDLKCLKVDSKLKGTWVGNFNALVDVACAVQAGILTLQNTFNTWNAGGIKVRVSLGCLESNVCGTNEYTIAQLFEIIFAELCKIKASLGTGGAPSSTLYIPS